MLPDERSKSCGVAFGSLPLAMLAMLAMGGCGAPDPRPRTVDELAADPIVLQGLVARCAADGRAAANDVECTNARLATERLGNALDAERRRVHEEEFARQRERRRAAEEAQRRAEAEARPPFDPYTAPVPPAAPAPAAEAGPAR
jgi:hypothetical protein